MGQVIHDNTILNSDSTIVAVATPPGTGGIAVIRVSGPEAIAICSKGWKGSDLSGVSSHTVHLGSFSDREGNLLDECVATVFRSPRSYTGEDTVEISVHGSPWIQRAVVEAILSYGAKPAEPGEFTRRAFINGRLDLTQAEGVADLIASSSRAAHRLAMQQASGGFSRKISELREKLMEFASLIELELDFSEEDVEFADRGKLTELARESRDMLRHLAGTFRSGQVLKAGIPVVIAGPPNAGKSTMLNRLLREDKAIVTSVAGTTRDILEDTIELGGVLFRFFDTAGIHESKDEVELIGIDKAIDRLSNARIVIWMTDSTTPLQPQLKELERHLPTLKSNDTTLILYHNKADLVDHLTEGKTATESETAATGVTPLTATSEILSTVRASVNTIELSGSASTGAGIQLLETTLASIATSEHNPDSELIVTNARHAAAIEAAAQALTLVIDNLQDGLSHDFIAMDIREAIAHLSELTGAITTDLLLQNIFSRFCIGK